MTNTLETLTQQLKHHDHHTRSQVISALIQLDDARKYDVLVDALQTETDVFITEDIIWALVQHKDEAIGRVIGLLAHTDPTVRQRAVHTLGKMGDARAVEALIPVLHDADKKVVLKCIFVLGQIGDIRAIPALVGMLGSDDVDIEGELIQILNQFGVSALPHLTDATTHPDWRVREQAISILGEIGDLSAVPSVITTLNDAQWEVRFMAIQTLHRLDKRKLRDISPSLQNDPDKRVLALVNRLVK
ncbi:MAG: HEAT repeat domain-containing protein [Anaerolineae bacterium]|nr:HEAT repeat domain-containing protein [Anaerolineae bacterium]